MNQWIRTPLSSYRVLLYGALSLCMPVAAMTESSELFRPINHAVITAKVEHYKKQGRRNSFIKKVIIPGAIAAGALGAYALYTRSSSSSSSIPEKKVYFSKENVSKALENSKKKMIELMGNNRTKVLPTYQPPILPKKSQSVDLRVINDHLSKKNVWVEGFPVQWDQAEGLKKLFLLVFGVTLLQTGSRMAANNFWSIASSCAKKLYHASFFPGLSSQNMMDENEEEIITLLSSLKMTYAGLVRSQSVPTDVSYFKQRLARLHILLSETIENFIAIAAYHAWKRNDVATYAWILDPSNGLIESAHALIELGKQHYVTPESVNETLFSSSCSKFYEALASVLKLSLGYHEKV